jgi:hypothetical protein
LLIASFGFPLAGCGSDASSDSANASSGEDNADGNEGSETAADESGSGSSDTSGGDGDAETDTGSGDGGNAECILWELDDCPEGLKCMPYSNNQTGVAMETRCCDLSDNPKLVGEPCSFEEYWGACIDDCENGSMCVQEDPDALTGICMPFCDINLGDSACNNGESCKPWFEMIESAYTVPMCMPICHPLEQNCAELGFDGWTCLPDAISDPVFVCTPPPAGTRLASCKTSAKWAFRACPPISSLVARMRS